MEKSQFFIASQRKNFFTPKRIFSQINNLILAHLSRRLIGELIVYPWSGVRPSSVIRPSIVVHNAQTSSSQKPLGRSKPNFIWSLLGLRERKFVRGILVTWLKWSQSPYMIKPFKKFLLRNRRGDFNETWYVASRTPAHLFVQIMTLEWPWPILRQGQIW